MEFLFIDEQRELRCRAEKRSHEKWEEKSGFATLCCNFRVRPFQRISLWGWCQHRADEPDSELVFF